MSRIIYSPLPDDETEYYWLKTVKETDRFGPINRTLTHWEINKVPKWDRKLVFVEIVGGRRILLRKLRELEATILRLWEDAYPSYSYTTWWGAIMLTNGKGLPPGSPIPPGMAYPEYWRKYFAADRIQSQCDWIDRNCPPPPPKSFRRYQTV